MEEKEKEIYNSSFSQFPHYNVVNKMIQWVIRVEKKWRPLPLCEVTMITEEFRMCKSWIYDNRK